MNDQEKIDALRVALAGATGVIDALAHIVERENPKTAAKARELADTYAETIKSTAP